MSYTEIERQALGLSREHLLEVMQQQRQFLLHKDMLVSWQLLQADALDAGFDLQLVSAFRDFERQKAIFNAKAQGERQLLDDAGQVLDYFSLNPMQRLLAILRWSAMPGASRHHWGCDIDVFDAKAMNFKAVQLVPSEVEANGPCAPMHNWLSDKINSNQSHGFYRPYEYDCGGVAPERWHLSYAPQSMVYERVLNKNLLLSLLGESTLELFAEIQKNIDTLYPRFVTLSTQNRPDWVLAL